MVISEFDVFQIFFDEGFYDISCCHIGSSIVVRITVPY